MKRIGTWIVAFLLGAWAVTPSAQIRTGRSNAAVAAAAAAAYAPIDAAYWTSSANGTLSAEVSLSGFTGLVKNTAGTPSAYAGAAACGQVYQAVTALDASGASTCGEVTPRNVKIATTVVGSLGTCNGAAQGTVKIVTDALTPVSLAAVSAGGAEIVPVYCNGTGWIVF